jgi:transmembrane sensor
MDERILKYFQNELDAAERLELLREIRKDDILKKQFSEYQNLCALINLSSYGENIDEGKNKYSYFNFIYSFLKL